nr:MAG TPA: hypothetical protein [Caudoviricetes sp.]DAZ22240.1 MAG TPA: hypothetical protein [Caudoviricetes sp.]
MALVSFLETRGTSLIPIFFCYFYCYVHCNRKNNRNQLIKKMEDLLKT